MKAMKSGRNITGPQISNMNVIKYLINKFLIFIFSERP